MSLQGKNRDREVVRVPGAHCKIDKCHKVGSVHCKVKQENTKADKPCPINRHEKKLIQVVPESIVLEAECHDVDVCADIDFEPGCVDVYGPDVHIVQDIEVEVFKPHVHGCKPEIRLHCKGQTKKVSPARVRYHDGKVNVTFGKVTYKCGDECDRPSGGVNPCKKKDCDKKPHHGKRPRH